MKLRFASPLVATAIAVLGLVVTTPVPARAIPVVAEWEGFTHHNSKPTEEDVSRRLAINFVTGTNFTGHFGEFTISGKIINAVGADQKLTFSGQGIGSNSRVKLKAGKARISATGLYCVGSFKVTGSPVFSGGHTFAGAAPMHALPLGAATGGRIRVLASHHGLAPGYSGHAHSGTQAALENDPFLFVVGSIQSNGRFTGLLGSVPVNGRVTGAGKVTFSGGDSQGGDHRNINNGVAQLSAEGNFLLGTFTVTGTGIFAPEAGKYTFESGAVN